MSTITRSYATGNVSGNHMIGGFAGDLFRSTVTESYSAGGTITATGTSPDFAGGFSGLIEEGSTVSGCSSVNPVMAGNRAGGFTGYIGIANVSDSYAWGSVSPASESPTQLGGFVGYLESGAVVARTYATGEVLSGECIGFDLDSGRCIAWALCDAANQATSECGGYAGASNATGEISVTSSYWNSDVVTVNGVDTGLHSYGAPLVESAFFSSENFPGWDTVSVWNFDGLSFPTLK
jgi:hypothetical protein